jgi:hypothetical protein
LTQTRQTSDLKLRDILFTDVALQYRCLVKFEKLACSKKEWLCYILASLSIFTFNAESIHLSFDFLIPIGEDFEAKAIPSLWKNSISTFLTVETLIAGHL